jgi:Raf kinase inhibitor-like YbhB/YbcL family protein
MTFPKKSLAIFSLLLCALIATQFPVLSTPQSIRGALSVTSPDFGYGMRMPSKNAQDNENQLPTLIIADVPPGTRSLAIQMVDPDNPSGVWIHWLAANIPASTRTLSADTLPDEMISGINDFGHCRYDGPSPPSGTHHYLIHVFALDTVLNLQPGFNYRTLENAMWGHILQRSTLMGTYSKNL